MSASNRYIRQTSLKDFGLQGQQALAKAKVLVVGAGGLGVPVLQYLNAMGVGTLGIVEEDVVDISNLQRQVIYKETEIGKSKLASTIAFLKERNTETELIPFHTYLSRENALDIIKDFDIVVDASDNFATRYLINDACVILNKPFVYGALQGFEGQVAVFNYQDGPTYRCVFPKAPTEREIPNCNENGVLGIIPGIIGNFQALEVVKLITQIGEINKNKLFIYNGLTNSILKINLSTNPANKERSELENHYAVPNCQLSSEVTAATFSELISNKKDILILDVRTVQEFEDEHIPNSVNIPLLKLTGTTTEFSKNQDIYIICQSGQRSKQALPILQEQYPNNNCFSVQGGLNAYFSVCL